MNKKIEFVIISAIIVFSAIYYYVIFRGHGWIDFFDKIAIWVVAVFGLIPLVIWATFKMIKMKKKGVI